MSKIARKPIEVKPGVTITMTGQSVVVSGPKGQLSFVVPNGIKAEVVEGQIIISQVKKNDRETNALFGLTRAMLNNLVKGVSDGFQKKLELSGVGYRAQASGNILTLSVGYSHQVIIKADQGITFTVEENIITISGTDKAMIGDVAAKSKSGQTTGAI